MKKLAFLCDACGKMAVTEDGSELAWRRITCTFEAEPVGNAPNSGAPPARWQGDFCPQCAKKTLADLKAPAVISSAEAAE